MLSMSLYSTPGISQIVLITDRVSVLLLESIKRTVAVLGHVVLVNRGQGVECPLIASGDSGR